MSWPIRRAERLFGNSIAVTDGSRSLTYGQLAADVSSLASGLDRMAVASGGRVGVLAGNSIAHVECFLGVPAAGRILVDLNFRLSPGELEYMINDCGVESLVVDDTQLAVGRRLRDRCVSLGALVFDGVGQCPEDCIPFAELIAGAPGDVPSDPGENTPASISYTGGTTGKPKGVMLSHRNFIANARHNLLATGHSTDDRWLHVCPMFHVAGIANVLACTWVGSRQIVLPRFDAGAVIAAIRQQRITHLVLVPTMLGMLLEEIDRDASAVDVSSLVHIQYAASPISPALQARALEYFDCEVMQFYGMTEAAPTVTSLSAADHRRGHAGHQPYATRLRSIGVPVVGVEAEVRDPAGQRLGPGEVGELWLRGPNVMLGYWDRPGATNEVLVDGWYRSGDVARGDADGYLYLMDRLKDMIVSGAENVYSVEVEAALQEHPDVSEAAVFGIPHPRWGEAVHAVVVVGLDSAVTADDLIAHSRTLIAGYKVPRTIEIRRDEPLPKSGAGKILKKLLREPYWIGQDRRVS